MIDRAFLSCFHAFSLRIPGTSTRVAGTSGLVATALCEVAADGDEQRVGHLALADVIAGAGLQGELNVARRIVQAEDQHRQVFVG